MGYYSQVALVVKKSSYPYLLAAVARSQEWTRWVVDAVEDDAFDGDGETECIRLHFNDVKWYDENEFAQTIERFMDEQDDRMHPEFGYQFVRIGEDCKDNENRGDWLGLDITQEITF